MMWNGKMKARTISYDDAITSDEHLIAIFNKYGMKGTFNARNTFTDGGLLLSIKVFTSQHFLSYFRQNLPEEV